MMATKDLSKKQRVETEIDLRLYDLMIDFLETQGEISSQKVLALMRASYVRGYQDANKD